MVDVFFGVEVDYCVVFCIEYVVVFVLCVVYVECVLDVVG